MRSQTALLLFLVVVAAVTVSPSTGADSKQKLQIGVKKRIAPEDCPIKSRKGDRLKMHYTVRTGNAIFMPGIHIGDLVYCRAP